MHDEPSLIALFTFVARHPQTKKATQLNTLKPETAEERLVFEERQMVADARRAARNATAYEQHQGATFCTAHDLSVCRSMLALQTEQCSMQPSVCQQLLDRVCPDIAWPCHLACMLCSYANLHAVLTTFYCQVKLPRFDSHVIC